MQLDILDAPLLDLHAEAFRLPRPLGEIASPAWLCERLRSDTAAEDGLPSGLREAVRDLLCGHSYKPTGRGAGARPLPGAAGGSGSGSGGVGAAAAPARREFAGALVAVGEGASSAR